MDQAARSAETVPPEPDEQPVRPPRLTEREEKSSHQYVIELVAT